MKNVGLIARKSLVRWIIFALIFCSSVVIANSADNVRWSSTNAQSGQTALDIPQYVAKVRRDIKSNWYPPTNSFENSALIGLTIDKNGQLLKCNLIEPSPDEGFNNSLLQAAQKTQYLPLPKEVRDEVLNLSLTFGMQRRHVNK